MKRTDRFSTQNVHGIKHWPAEERPRERLIQGGAEALSDAQLIALVIRTGSKEKSAVDLSRDLIKMFGGLQKIGDAELAELREIRGIGPVKGAQIKALFELTKRIHSSPAEKGKQISTSEGVFRRYRSFYKFKRKEIFKSVLLDGKHRIIRDMVISEGSLNLSIVHPREAFNPAIRESAAAIIFIHNHPSGDPTPSQEDIETTHRLVEVGEIIGIKVLDHIIIGDGRYTSLNDIGLLNSAKRPSA